ncbi:MAG: DUF5413 family protein [Rhizobiales bacterium]|nr:DUF5413 family protein [Hyphomicrobiales bacterium]OJY44498.1 MAG: hypothetical protein BGP08_13870 [Rhizobiales bacterium 64-17]
MRRFLIFALLGPALGFVTAFWILLQAFNGLLGAPSTFDLHQVVLLPVAYMLGIGPALVTGLFDHVLARRGVRLRILWTTLFAYASAYLILLNAWGAGTVHGPALFLFGLIGAVPGAICAWLSGRA